MAGNIPRSLLFWFSFELLGLGCCWVGGSLWLVFR